MKKKTTKKKSTKRIVAGFKIGDRVKALAGDYGNAGGEVKALDAKLGVGVRHDSDVHKADSITWHPASNLVRA